MADQLLGPNPDLMPAIDSPPPASAKGKTTQRPEADAAAKSVPSSAGAAGASGDFPLETAPELPVDPQPIRGSLSPAAPAANPAPTTQNGQAGAALREHGLGPRPDIVPDCGGATGAAV